MKLNCCFVDFKGDEVSLVVSWTNVRKRVDGHLVTKTEVVTLTAGTLLAALVAAAASAPLVWWVTA